MKAESIAEELKQVQFYIYVIVAFVAWNPEPGWFTRLAWVVWTLAVIGTLIEEQKK